MEMEDHGTTWVMEGPLFEAGLQEGHVTPEHPKNNRHFMMDFER